jgi:hypothetical protein
MYRKLNGVKKMHHRIWIVKKKSYFRFNHRFCKLKIITLDNKLSYHEKYFLESYA